MEREAVKNEFQAMLAGAVPNESENNNEPVKSQPKVVSSRRTRSGALVETQQEKAMKFQGKVKKVRVDKDGNYIGDV